jgi:Ca2+-binding RTX toxin-like protein
VARRHPIALATLTLVFAAGITGLASAHDAGDRSADGRFQSAGDVSAAMADDHHGGMVGHLPTDIENVDLVSRLKLTDLADGIADVGYYKGYAYLNAWFPNCPNAGGTGGGVHVVDVRDPANPKKVGFLPSEANAVPGEGIHIMTVDTPFFKGDLLLHNNEACQDPSTLGMSIWDVTNPLAPKKLSQFGDATPPSDPVLTQDSTYHSIHSVQGFTQPGKAFAVMIDNDESFLPASAAAPKDVDIVDITNPAAPTMASELGLEDWPGAQGSYANGDTVFHHDVQFKRIGGHDFLAVSYWDAGQVILNVDNPANPSFVGDSDFKTPDPETGLPFSEGNSHESYWSSNDRFLISTDEDFSPFRTDFAITSGPNAGAYSAGEFGWTVPISTEPGGEISGGTVFGGRGCINGTSPGSDPQGDPAPPPASVTGENTVVFSRGGCFFSTKVESGQILGYDHVIIAQSHGATRAGLLKDSFFCGGQGHNFTVTASGVCVGHRAMHLLFNDPEEYTGPEGGDVPLGTIGADYSATGAFDGWGYVNLHDATNPNLPILDTYAITESLHPGFSTGFGDLSVHEVKTDPRMNVNLGYIAYYAGGLRVVRFGTGGISEVGKYIGPDGNNFWGVFPVGDEYAGHGYTSDDAAGKPLILASDRDFGLYIFRYSGSAGTCAKREVTALGTTGADRWKGTTDHDVVEFLDGNDKANGGQGKDRLCGDGGKDKLKGGAKRDILVGGPGRDRCVGGPGRDKFRGCEKEKQ